MKILADESVDRPIVERLRMSGHDVDYIAEIEPSISDREVLEAANKTRALLLTADKDFGELIYRDHLENAGGVILLRLAGLPPKEKAERVLEVIQDITWESETKFTVVTRKGVRFRSEY
jgi:predicted nuclease of predicted toxin-antitoxin system